MAQGIKTFKTQAELEAIKKAVTPEERANVIEQRRHSTATYAKKLTIGTNLIEGSPAFSLFQEASLYYGTPINASLDSNMRVIFDKTSEGVFKWRSDESIGGSGSKEALRCLLETLFEERNEDLLLEATKRMKTSRLFRSVTKNEAVELIQKVIDYRRKQIEGRTAERLEDIKDALRNMPQDRVRELLEEIKPNQE